MKEVLESEPWKSSASRLAHIGRELEAALGQVLARYPACLDAICHGDLQIGNVILDDDGHPRIVDLDNLLIGTIYSDGITGLIWRGASAEVLSRFCAKLASEESRSAARHDAGLAIANALAWCASAMRSEQTPLVDEQMSRLRVGLEQALQFASSLPTD